MRSISFVFLTWQAKSGKAHVVLVVLVATPLLVFVAPMVVMVFIVYSSSFDSLSQAMVLSVDSIGWRISEMTPTRFSIQL